MGMDFGGEDAVKKFGICVIIIGLSACSGISTPSAPPKAADAFFERLVTYCGKAFGGRLVSNEAPDADMVAMPMVMHVRNCSESEIRVPFHVGKADGSWDRSRTWIITRTPQGLRLKHDHRHEDGSHDKVTMYGGDTASEGTAQRQEFVVDAESIALFQREGLARSVTNIWAVEIDTPKSPNAKFAYELRRVGENARFFRVEFDLITPIASPPPPWGSE